MSHYIAIAEPSDDRRSWWISFPGLDGVTSAADDAAEIASQARDALESAVAAGLALPPAIEDGIVPLYEISDYENPLVVLVSVVAPVSAAAR
jgi:predicted RNase H-like HicB family nuclease